jgi:hypothetical protein
MAVFWDVAGRTKRADDGTVSATETSVDICHLHGTTTQKTTVFTLIAIIT